MKKMIMITLVGCSLVAVVCRSEEKLLVREEAVIQQQNPRGNARAGAVLRAARDPEGSGEKIYLKFDASEMNSVIEDIVAFEGFILATKFPRSASAYFITGDGADEWAQDTITWDNAPGNDKSSGGKLLSSGSFLGSFPPPEKDAGRTVALKWNSDDAKKLLIAALNTGDRVATIAILRSTEKDVRFASRKNTDRGAHSFQMNVIFKNK